MAFHSDTSGVLERTHSDALHDHGVYVFMGDVNNESIAPVIEWILHESFVAKKKKRELLLMICSDGGDRVPLLR